jgi:RNA polymerase sigma-70 factor (ECF subfamily)
MQRTPIPVEEVPDHPGDDQWDVHLDRILAEYTLFRLSDTHRAVLTLRYVDDCTVAQCAEMLDRTVTATEALLTRAKRAFRASYPSDPATSAAKGGRR